MFSSNEREDRVFFNVLYEKYFGKVHSFVLRNTRDADEAEDVTHDVFLKLWQNRDRFSSVVPPDAQLLVISRQLIINNYKRGLVEQRAFLAWQEHSPSVTAGDASEHLIRSGEMAAAIDEAVQSLPAKRREIFEKSRYDGLSYDQIAQEMAISRNTVESHMSKALHFLRKKLPLLVISIFF